MTEVTAANFSARVEGQGVPADKGRAASRFKYRPDIDGLRAIAVLSVIAFHLQVADGPFGGGFVGVDIFFVISGYLISSVVFSEIANSKFSIVSFYERRTRRIFPALFAMLAGTSILAYLYLLPSELVTYAKSLLAATLSVSNFYFWSHSGYFDSPLTNPLLHTWSLAVEEQFYIVFPVFLWLVRRYASQRLRLMVGVLAAISFCISAVGAYRDPTATFYAPYTRAWELLLGTMLALQFFPPIRSALLRNVAGLGGLAGIVFTVHWYTKNTPFPGMAALLPCAGAALIIAAGEHGTSAVGRILSLRPVVFVGLISYSLYLWHWPILVFKEFGAFYGVGQSHRNVELVTLALTAVFALLSWRFVERPFRSGKLLLSGAPLFRLAGAAAGVLVVISVAALFSRGLAYRFPPRAVQVASYLGAAENFASTRMGTCFISSAFHFENYQPAVCLKASDTKQNDLLIGDSHSAVLWNPLQLSLRDANVMQASASGCKPFVDLKNSGNCGQLMNYVYKDYLPGHKIDALWVANRWQESDIPEVGKLILWARRMSIPVVLFGPTPEYDTPLPRLLAISIADNQPDISDKHRIESIYGLDAKLQLMAAQEWHVPYISLLQVVCGREACMQYADGARTIPMMSDRDHLTNEGALLVTQTLIKNGQLH